MRCQGTADGNTVHKERVRVATEESRRKQEKNTIEARQMETSALRIEVTRTNQM